MGKNGYLAKRDQMMQILTPELEQVDRLEETERGDGGFGSTGKF